VPRGYGGRTVHKFARLLLVVSLAVPAGTFEPLRASEPSHARHEDPAIARALALVDSDIGPVTVIDGEQARQMYARVAGAGEPPRGLNAFRAPGDPADRHIYVLGSSAVYQAARRRPTTLAVLKLAATLVHERAHDSEGESGAYRLQALFVKVRLGTLPPSQRSEGQRYLEALEMRAAALAPERLLALRTSSHKAARSRARSAEQSASRLPHDPAPHR
jgi:hypothetical protein